MLATLAKTGNVSASARAADIDRTTHYRWFHSDAEYARAVQIAMDDAVDVLEAVARQRAIPGSDTLLIFLLKGHRPEKYRDPHEVKHAGRVTIEERGDPFEILRDPEVRRVPDDYTARKYMKGQDVGTRSHFRAPDGPAGRAAGVWSPLVHRPGEDAARGHTGRVVGHRVEAWMKGPRRSRLAKLDRPPQSAVKSRTVLDLKRAPRPESAPRIPCAARLAHRLPGPPCWKPISNPSGRASNLAELAFRGPHRHAARGRKTRSTASPQLVTSQGVRFRGDIFKKLSIDPARVSG